MKLNLISAALFVIALVCSSSAQVSVYIGSPPPPLRVEVRGQMPGPGYAWVEGYWAPQRPPLPLGPGTLGPASLRRRLLESPAL